jgi:hypothetical protein
MTIEDTVLRWVGTQARRGLEMQHVRQARCGCALVMTRWDERWADGCISKMMYRIVN